MAASGVEAAARQTRSTEGFVREEIQVQECSKSTGSGEGHDRTDLGCYGEKAKAFWQQRNEVNRSAIAGVTATFHPELYGSDEIEFTEESWGELAEEWSASLVGIFFGTRPSLWKVTGYVRARWGDEKCVSVSQMDLGIFLFRFKSVGERDRIVDSGPWTFENRPLVLKLWSPDETYSLDSVNSLPVWVRFPKLGAHLRRIDALSMIASSVGKPLRTDGYTCGKTKLMYARMLVEVFASKELKRSVTIKGPNGVSFVQRVEYDWLPPRCANCQSFGHTDKSCKWPNIPLEEDDDNEERTLIEPARARGAREANTKAGDNGTKRTVNVTGSDSDECSLISVVPETQKVVEVDGVAKEGVGVAEEVDGVVEEVESRPPPKVNNGVRGNIEENIEDCNEEVSSREETCDSNRDVQAEKVLVAEQPFIEVKKKGKVKGTKSKKKKVISSQDSDMNIKLKNLVPRSKGKREVKCCEENR